eukprot:gene11010-14738_t
MTQQYGVSGIRIDRGNLVVETPQYSGMGTDGSRYLVKAREARTPLGVSGRIDMIDAMLDYTRPGHSAFHVRGATASVDTARQYVTVPGVARLNSDDGMHGTLTEVRSDLKAEITRAEGPIDITFTDGTHLEAADLLYEGKLSYWTFNRSTDRRAAHSVLHQRLGDPVIRRLLLAALLALPLLAAAEAPNPVKITSDKFEVDDAKHLATFTGKVVVLRKDLTVWAPKVVVDYGDGGPGNIKTFVASGGVRIKTPSQDAT